MASAAAVFQKLMHRLFKKVDGVQYFQDDIMVMGRTREDHDAKLNKVLSILEQNGLTAEWNKCRFGVRSVAYLGHEISEKGVTPKTLNVGAIKEAPTPDNKDDVRSFLGMAEFYSKFVPHFATKTHHLRQLLKEKTSFTWTPETQEEFQQIKEELCTALPLQGFDQTAISILTTDASERGLGAVLMQRDKEGSVSTISFASRSLAPNEERYSVIEKEMLAVVWAMTKFRQFLWGTRFLLKTDHKPLVKVLTSSGHAEATPRIAKMTLKLLDYVYDVEYIPGTRNKVADYLSRAAAKEAAPLHTKEDEYIIAFTSDYEAGISAQEWKEGYDQDAGMKQLKQHITRGWPEKRHICDDMKKFYEVREELSVCDRGIFVMRGDRVVPPNNLIVRLMTLIHQGHLGIVKTKLAVKKAYWWPAQDKQVEEFVRSCAQCESADKGQVLLRPPLGKFVNPKNPWEEVSIDILGPVLDAEGVPKYTTVMIDRYSKWPEVEVTETTDTETVLAFITSVFLREGIPKVVTSDNGPQFTSERWAMFMKRNGIHHKLTPVYHPAGNGLVERFNRVVMGSIQAAISAGKDWQKELKNTVWAYRITPTKTGYSPFKILRGRDPFTRDNIAWKQRTTQSKWSPAMVRRNLERAQEIYTNHFNKRRSVKKTSLEEGEWVRIRKAQLQRKGESRYSEPLQVKEVYNRSAMLSDGKVWSQDRMAKCNKVMDWGPPNKHQEGRKEQCVPQEMENTQKVPIQAEGKENEDATNPGEQTESSGRTSLGTRGEEDEAGGGSAPKNVEGEASSCSYQSQKAVTPQRVTRTGRRISLPKKFQDYEMHI